MLKKLSYIELYEKMIPELSKSAIKDQIYLFNHPDNGHIQQKILAMLKSRIEEIESLESEIFEDHKRFRSSGENVDIENSKIV